MKLEKINKQSFRSKIIILIITVLMTGGMDRRIVYAGNGWCDTCTGNVYYDGGKVGIGTTTPDGDLTFGNATSLINLDTATGSDNKRLVLAGSGGWTNTRGAFMILNGNDHGNAGKLQLFSGDPGVIEMYTTTSGLTSELRVTIDNDGNFKVLTGNLVVGGTIINQAGDLLLAGSNSSNTSFVNMDTADGSDNKRLVLSSSGYWGNARGANIMMAGNEHNGNAGRLQLQAGDVAGGQIHMITGSQLRVTIDEVGNVGIGTVTPDPNHTLTVKGSVITGEIKVSATWADFVFNKDYNLLPLDELEESIKKNKHLPEIPSAKEVEKNGISLGKMQSKLLQKIEELTLYVIEQNKKIEAQNKKIAALEKGDR